MHVYACNASMTDTCLANADGDFLIVPQQGEARLARALHSPSCILCATLATS